MSKLAIHVEKLSKMYRIGGPQERYQTFRDALVRTLSAPFQRAYDMLRGKADSASGLKEEIWALKDITFEVNHGEVIGIIGRNGAGKSTLLKILSRITEPTKGYADIYGRVGALLEVGTGFHPELTGRENVYLNSAILGMSRRDIEHKFDEIVAFAGVEKFIDTPVKHYSSGMGLRLGFSVAAHLEPEILIVDEVLAVGDAEFQKKCLGKMSAVAKEGRTVLFVSHNLAAVRNLCQRGILLEAGQIVMDAPVDAVLDRYMQPAVGLGSDIASETLQTDKRFQIQQFELRSEHDELIPCAMSGMDLKLFFRYTSSEPQMAEEIMLIFKNQLGQLLFTCSSLVTSGEHQPLHSVGELVCQIPHLPLVPGEYTFSLVIKPAQDRQNLVRYEDLFRFEVIEGDYFGTGRQTRARLGSILVKHAWAFTEGAK